MLTRVRRRLRRFADGLRVARHRPVIILGTQKSGTSAIAHLLADRCGLSKTIDIPALWPPGVLRIIHGEERLADLVHREPQPFLAAIVKEPYLVYIYDQVAAAFPAARFVFVIRDPRDTLRSVLNRLAIPGDLPFLDLNEWPIPDAWRPVFEPTHWGLAGSAHYVETLAVRWSLAAKVYLQHRPSITLIRYEDFNAGKLEAVDRLAVQLGLTPTANVAHRLDVQYQPAGKNRGTPLEVFFGAENLRRIHDRCGEIMRELGYRPSTG